MAVLGDNIKAFRERAGYSIRKLSELSGVSKSVISEIESGKATKPRYETLDKLSSALGVTIPTLTEMEVEHEYIVTDINEAFEVILNQKNLTINGQNLTTEAKTQLINGVKMALKFAEEVQNSTYKSKVKK